MRPAGHLESRQSFARELACSNDVIGFILVVNTGIRMRRKNKSKKHSPTSLTAYDKENRLKRELSQCRNDIIPLFTDSVDGFANSEW